VSEVDDQGTDVQRPEERIAALEAENRTLEANLEAVDDRLLRLAAEFDNWKKRAGREQAEAERRGREVVLRDAVDIVDGLQRALASLDEHTDAQAVRDGVSLLLRALQQKLERHGVRSIEATGRRFDPRLHDAIARAPRQDVDPGTVVSEVRKGYLMGDRLLRPAAVVVAEAPQPPAGAHP
jgi:molecular chaperone GrpE